MTQLEVPGFYQNKTCLLSRNYCSKGLGASGCSSKNFYRKCQHVYDTYACRIQTFPQDRHRLGAFASFELHAKRRQKILSSLLNITISSRPPCNSSFLKFFLTGVFSFLAHPLFLPRVRQAIAERRQLSLSSTFIYITC